MKAVMDEWTAINWDDVKDVGIRQKVTVDDTGADYAFFVYVKESALQTDLCMTGSRTHALFLKELVHQFWRLSQMEIDVPEEGA